MDSSTASSKSFIQLLNKTFTVIVFSLLLIGVTTSTWADNVPSITWSNSVDGEGSIYHSESEAAQAARSFHTKYSDKTIRKEVTINTNARYDYYGPHYEQERTEWSYYDYTRQYADEAEIIPYIKSVFPSQCSSTIVTPNGWIPYIYSSGAGYFNGTNGPASETRLETQGYDVTRHFLNQFTGECYPSDTSWTAFRSRYYQCPVDVLPAGAYWKPNPSWLNGCDSYPPFSVTSNKPFEKTSCDKEGNPCNARTGDKLETEVDFDDGWLRFERTYHSLGQTHDSNLGVGWTHGYSSYFFVHSTNTTQVQGFIREDGYHESMLGSSGNYHSTSDGSDRIQLTFMTTEWESTRVDWKDYYDLTGKLIRREPNNGPTIYFSYDSEGRIELIQDDTGRTLTLYYNGNNIDKITRPDNLDIVYHYDVNNNLYQIDYPDGSHKTYHYEDTNFPHHLTGITDERGNRSYYSYDATTAQVISSVPVGGIKSKSFSYQNGESLVTDSKGNIREYVFASNNTTITDICNGCDDSVFYVTRDYIGVPIWVGRNGIVDQYAGNDLKGQPSYITEAYWNNDVKRRTDFEYDSRFFNKITEKREHSIISTSTLGACIEGTNCQVTNSTYDDDGNLTSRTISGFQPDSTPISRTTTWQYNGAYGQLSQIDGPRTDVSDITTLEYYSDSPNEGRNRGRLKKVTLPNGTIQRDNIRYGLNGKIQDEVRPNGEILYYTYYPGNDRLDSLIRSDNAIYQVTKFTYEPTGEVKTITQADWYSSASTTTFTYDAAKQLTRITDDVGNYIEYSYDSEGNQTSEDIYDTTSTLTRNLSKTYDRFNRLDLTQRNFSTDDSDIDVDGTLDKTTDGNGVVTDYSYDNLRRLTSSIQDMGNLDITTQYVYDVADRLVQVIDPENLSTNYSYDDLGNLLSLNSPDTGITSYEYDDAGNRTKQTDANGIIINYSYDELNRLTYIDYPNDMDVTYTYDESNNGQNGVGRLTTITDASGTTFYAYDFRGNLTNQTHTQDSLTFTTGYDYNLRDELIQTTYPSGRTVDYLRNSIGRITSVTTTSNGQTDILVSNASYLPFGPLTSFTQGNGIVETQSYDADYRLTNLVSSLLQDISYQYDGANNIKDIIDNTSTQATLRDQSFSYDPINRLDIANLLGTSEVYDYGYDDVGNRLSLDINGNTTAYGYSTANHHLNSITNNASTSLIYDAVGNMTSDGGNTVTYNDFNQIDTIDDGTSTLGNYIYNANNQRTKKTDNLNTVSYYKYDISGNFIAELNSTGISEKEYIYLDNQLLTVLVEENVIQGTSNWDTLQGTEGRDIMTGGLGNDSLYAYGGNDVLMAGGAGSSVTERNRLVGYNGHDVFHLDLDWGLAFIINYDTGFQNNIDYTDSVRFGYGILPSDILLEAMPNERGAFKGLHLTHTPTGNKAVIYRHHNGGDGYRMDQVIFMEDGTVWSDEDMDVMLGLASKENDDDSHQYAVNPATGWAFGEPYYVYQTRWRDRRVSLQESTATQLVASTGGAE